VADLTLSQKIKQFSKEAGADLVGITPAFVDEENIARLREFIEKRRQGLMKYLEDVEVRANPQSFLPGAKSVIVIGVNYFSQTAPTPPGHGKIARYANGRDYHKVLKAILKKVAAFIISQNPDANCKICVDSAPLLEKYFAVKAGLGFIGNNTTLITPDFGSFVVLGELLTDLQLDYDKSAAGTCGTCKRCLEACPTKALIGPDIMDARRCISYLTIEHKGKIAPALASKIGNRIFGCDICQEVCPYNRVHARETKIPDFQKPIAGANLSLKDITNIKSDAEFLKRFAGSPLMRAKRAGLQRNARIALSNKSCCPTGLVDR
jgi:epoxyqueuosine reductase